PERPVRGQPTEMDGDRGRTREEGSAEHAHRARPFPHPEQDERRDDGDRMLGEPPSDGPHPPAPSGSALRSAAMARTTSSRSCDQILSSSAPYAGVPRTSSPRGRPRSTG